MGGEKKRAREAAGPRSGRRWGFPPKRNTCRITVSQRLAFVATHIAHLRSPIYVSGESTDGGLPSLVHPSDFCVLTFPLCLLTKDRQIQHANTSYCMTLHFEGVFAIRLPGPLTLPGLICPFAFVRNRGNGHRPFTCDPEAHGIFVDL